MTNIKEIHIVTTGIWKQNGYIVESQDGHGVIIDPGAEPQRFIDLIEFRQINISAILNTHAHYDHIGAVLPLVEHFRLSPFYLHNDDRNLLRQANTYRRLFGSNESIRVPTEFTDLVPLIDVSVRLGGLSIQCIATPGHTRGSVCFLIEDEFFFSGDTLLPTGPGRTDLPGGSSAQMKETIHRLLNLSGHFMMYPGHGRPCGLSEALCHTISMPPLVG